MLSIFKRSRHNTAQVPDHVLVAMADGEMIPIETVDDPVFAEKILGDGVAFRLEGSKVTLTAPANGTITTQFSTRHAFGMETRAGVELLVHVGINTAEAKGAGFKMLKKSGDPVKAGDPVLTVDVKSLEARYDMTTMLIVTDPKNKKITFRIPGAVSRGEHIAE